MIALRGIQRTYPTPAGPFTALRDVDFDATAGELVAIVGKSGSGKSTLLNMIGAIDRPTAGTVVVDGTDILSLDENRLARWRGASVGIVFQSFQLLPTLTVLENVMLPMDFLGKPARRQRMTRAQELLERVGLGRHADKLPSALSGGEQQRAAIARAVANDPRVVIADEPTGNLDSGSAEAVLALFRRMTESGTAVVIATHDPDIVSVADRTVGLVDGQAAPVQIAFARTARVVARPA